MEYIAIAKNIKISPRKMRLVVDGVKKQNVKAALSSLTVMNKRASGPIGKAINSAIANATNNFKANRDELVIKDIMVTDGAVLKRFHYAGRGRTRPYKRRASHIRVVLMDNKSVQPTIDQVALPAKVEEPKKILTGSKNKKGKEKSK
jgi:large subunit ribosomal protein L22